MFFFSVLKASETDLREYTDCSPWYTWYIGFAHHLITSRIIHTRIKTIIEKKRTKSRSIRKCQQFWNGCLLRWHDIWAILSWFKLQNVLYACLSFAIWFSFMCKMLRRPLCVRKLLFYITISVLKEDKKKITTQNEYRQWNNMSSFLM